MSEHKQPDPSRNRLANLLYVIEGLKKRFLITLLIGLFLNAFISIVSPLSIKYLFDEGIIRGNFRLFVVFSIAFVLTFTFWRAGQYFYRLYLQRLRIDATKQLSLRMLSNYFERPYDEIIKQQPGYFVSRVYDEVASAAPPLLDSSFSLCNSIITLVVASIIASSISWQAALTIALSVPLVYAASRRFAVKIKALAKIEKEEEARLRGVLGRAVNAHKIVRTFNLKPPVIDNVRNHFLNFAEAFIRRFKSAAKYEIFSGTLMSYVETIATIGAGYQMLRGRLSFGGFMGFMNAFWLVIGSVKGIFDQVPEMSRVAGLVERLREFEKNDGLRANVHLSDRLKLEDVTFAYNGKAILQNLRFELRPGEHVLIVGPNGSGKSTLAHVISGFLEPSAGATITFPLDRISAVIHPQDFIPGTVRDNVSFVRSDGETSKCERLLSEFGLREHLEKDTSQLSAGQRKKLELVMSLAKDADFYIIDEPLAGLDVASKENVMNEIFKCTQDRILVAIMHGDEQYHIWFDRILDLGADPEFAAKEEDVPHYLGRV